MVKDSNVLLATLAQALITLASPSPQLARMSSLNSLSTLSKVYHFVMCLDFSLFSQSNFI